MALEPDTVDIAVVIGDARSVSVTYPPGDLNVAVSGAPHPVWLTLNELTDVTVPTPGDGDVLVHHQGEWLNSPPYLAASGLLDSAVWRVDAGTLTAAGDGLEDLAGGGNDLMFTPGNHPLILPHSGEDYLHLPDWGDGDNQWSAEGTSATFATTSVVECRVGYIHAPGKWMFNLYTGKTRIEFSTTDGALIPQYQDDSWVWHNGSELDAGLVPGQVYDLKFEWDASGVTLTVDGGDPIISYWDVAGYVPKDTGADLLIGDWYRFDIAGGSRVLVPSLYDERENECLDPGAEGGGGSWYPQTGWDNTFWSIVKRPKVVWRDDADGLATAPFNRLVSGTVVFAGNLYGGDNHNLFRGGEEHTEGGALFRGSGWKAEGAFYADAAPVGAVASSEQLVVNVTAALRAGSGVASLLGTNLNDYDNEKFSYEFTDYDPALAALVEDQISVGGPGHSLDLAGLAVFDHALSDAEVFQVATEMFRGSPEFVQLDPLGGLAVPGDLTAGRTLAYSGGITHTAGYGDPEENASGVFALPGSTYIDTNADPDEDKPGHVSWRKSRGTGRYGWVPVDPPDYAQLVKDEATWFVDAGTLNAAGDGLKDLTGGGNDLLFKVGSEPLVLPYDGEPYLHIPGGGGNYLVTAGGSYSSPILGKTSVSMHVDADSGGDPIGLFDMTETPAYGWSIVVSGTGVVTSHARDDTGIDEAKSTAPGAFSFTPGWHKFDKEGFTVTYYTSPDGGEWTLEATLTHTGARERTGSGGGAKKVGCVSVHGETGQMNLRDIRLHREGSDDDHIALRSVEADQLVIHSWSRATGYSGVPDWDIHRAASGLKTSVVNRPKLLFGGVVNQVMATTSFPATLDNGAVLLVERLFGPGVAGERALLLADDDSLSNGGVEMVESHIFKSARDTGTTTTVTLEAHEGLIGRAAYEDRYMQFIAGDPHQRTWNQYDILNTGSMEYGDAGDRGREFLAIAVFPRALLKHEIKGIVQVFAAGYARDYTLVEQQAVLAASTDFADYQSRVAGLS